MTYVRNAWYVGATSAEVTNEPRRRVVLDDPVVLFRTESGQATALFDRCPHRMVPLSRGSVRGSTIECAYHGLCFDTNGRCVHNPHGETVPVAAKVKAYPLVERYGFVWIWPGDPDHADPGALPDFRPFDQGDRAGVVSGYLRVAANYQLVTDNLLDLGHVEFLHRDFATSNGLDVAVTEVQQEGDTIFANRWKRKSTVSPFLRSLWQSESEVGDARANMCWHPPSLMLLDVGVTEVDAPTSEGISTPFLHLLTPETEVSTHYFWSMARDCALDDSDLTRRLKETAARVFETEDRPMIEAQQQEIGSGRELMDLGPVLLPFDVPSVRARRIVARLVREERTRSGMGSSMGTEQE
jgi:phenylpropionate dioxygenase-like ring-hydroxylating dioxygenase large terminal subunit